MNGLEVLKYISKDASLLSLFGGLFAKDQLTFDIPDRNIFYICNTDLAKNRGKHWIVIYSTLGSNRIEYFDSLGNYPPHNFVKFMTKTKKSIIFNKKKVQATSSKSCGYFCLYFIMLRYRNISYKNIIDNFSNSNDLNEKHVTEFIKQTLI